METNRIFPDNWKDVIRGKKVILYNTGVTSLLQVRETRIEKMKWVFDVFKEHPEVVLWWRPHPLEVSTVHSMLPELEEQYMEVRRQYVEEGIGILDESADLNRAIAISDAYYGAFSSMVELFKAAGKPVLYENYKVRKMEEAAFLPASLCVKDNFIWFLQLNSNKLVQVDRTTYRVEKIISIDEEPSFRRRAYNYHIIDIGDSLLLLLGNSNQIYEYEIETGIIKVHRPDVRNFVFRSELVLEKSGKLFLFPYGGRAILEYNYRSGTTFAREFAQKKVNIGKCYESIGEKVYAVDKDSNTLYQYDIVDLSFAAINIGAKDNRYWGVKKTGDYFVLPHTEKNAVTLWKEKNGETIELTEFPENFDYLKDYAYLDMFEKNGEFYIFPFYANMILKVDVENKKITEAFRETSFKANYVVGSETFSDNTYLCTMRNDDSVYAFSLYKKCWQIFDLNTLDIQESLVFGIDNAEHKKIVECILDENDTEKFFCEGESFVICHLENYIRNLVQYNAGSKSNELNKDNIGVAIYKALITEL